MSCPYETALGALALGVLEPDDHAQVENHLAQCSRCAETYRDLAGLPAALAMVSPDEITSPPVGPGELGYQRLRRAAAGTRYARRRAAFLAAAALIVLSVGVVGGVRTAAGPAPSATTVVAESGPLRASAQVTATDAGTRIELELEGATRGRRCALVAVAHDGREETAGSWTAGHDGTVAMTGTVSILPDQLDRLVVRALDGPDLLTLPGPA